MASENNDNQAMNLGGFQKRFVRRQFGLGKDVNATARAAQKKFDMSATQARRAVERLKKEEGW